MFHHDISTGYTVKLYFLTMLINVKLFEEKKKKNEIPQSDILLSQLPESVLSNLFCLFIQDM